MARRGPSGDPVDWVTRAADEAIARAGEGNLVTCAVASNDAPGALRDGTAVEVQP